MQALGQVYSLLERSFEGKATGRALKDGNAGMILLPPKSMKTILPPAEMSSVLFPDMPILSDSYQEVNEQTLPLLCSPSTSLVL